jgi:hypothetical protein
MATALRAAAATLTASTGGSPESNDDERDRDEDELHGAGVAQQEPAVSHELLDQDAADERTGEEVEQRGDRGQERETGRTREREPDELGESCFGGGGGGGGGASGPPASPARSVSRITVRYDGHDLV